MSSNAAPQAISRRTCGGKIDTISHDDAARAVAAGRPIADCDLAEVRWRDLPDGRMVARNCTLSDGDLSDAMLGDAVFDHCTFLSSKFSSAELSASRWVSCILYDAEKRRGCSFFSAQLDAATFENSNLSMCTFENASLHGVSLKECKAAGASFETANFSRRVGRQLVAAGEMTSCALDLASFASVALDRFDFSQSTMRQADFSDANLVETTFRGADLTGATITNANLDKADLREGTLDELDLRSARSFAGIKVSRSQLSALAGPFGIRVFPD